MTEKEISERSVVSDWCEFMDMNLHTFLLAIYQDGNVDYEYGNKKLKNGKKIGETFTNIIGEHVHISKCVIDKLLSLQNKNPLYGTICFLDDDKFKSQSKHHELEFLNFCGLNDYEQTTIAMVDKKCILLRSYDAEGG